MPFESPSQKTLWKLTAAYVILLYASAPFMRTVLGFLYYLLGRGNLSIIITASIAASGAGAALLAAYRRPGMGKRLVFPALALVVLMLALDIPEERVHIIEYGVLGLLVSLAGNARNDRRLPALAVLIIAIGAVDEGIQYLLPMRVGDIRDVLVNSAGGLIGLWLGRHC